MTRTIGEPIGVPMAMVRFLGEVLIAALAPLVGSISHEAPWILEPLRVAARVLRFTAIVPRTNLITLYLARVKPCDLVALALGPEPARFARDGVLAPTAVT